MLAVFVGVAVVAGYVLEAGSHAASCTVSSTLVNSCRPWLGAAVNGYSQTASDTKSQILYHEQRIGRQLDVVHTYHGVGTNTLSSSDIYFATRPNTYLFANWKPTSNWATISQDNSAIDSMANSVKSVAPNKIFLTIHHEPENDVTTDPNCPNVTYKGNFGTPTDYRNMWSYVENRFAADGVTNVVWVMNYMGYAAWDCLIPDMWPGNNLVDWVTWDAYSSSDSSTFANTVGRIYDLLTSLNDSSHDYESKPWGSAEWGDCKTADQAHIYGLYDQAKAVLDANTYPRLKMYMIYDDSGNNAGPGCMTEYSLAGVFDPTEQSHYNGFADDALFTDAHYATPTPATPIPTPAPPGTPTPVAAASPAPSPGLVIGGGSGDSSGSPTVSGSIPLTNIAPGAVVEIDGVPVREDGKINTKDLTNGTHTITITSGGKTTTQTITVHNKLNPFDQIRVLFFGLAKGNGAIMTIATGVVMLIVLGGVVFGVRQVILGLQLSNRLARM